MRRRIVSLLRVFQHPTLVTIVTNTINHSYWSYLHQLGYLGGHQPDNILGKFHHDRTLFSRTLEIMVSKANHPQMVLIQVSEIL